jgi:hypothetical protein
MNETLREILLTQQAMTWAWVVIATEGFLSIVVSAWALYVSRGTQASVERVRQSVERGEQSFERMGFYLFRKLGPIDLPPPQ